MTKLEIASFIGDLGSLCDVQGLANRRVGSTAMNNESSRSHSVFTFVIESRSKVLMTFFLCLNHVKPTPLSALLFI